MRQLYDLAGADPERRFSPYCWRVKLALALKGLQAATVPVRFTDKALIAFSGQDKVPVLRDGATVVADSMAIIRYLDQAYPDTPRLIGGTAEAGLIAFLRQWCERVVQARLLPLIVLDLRAVLSASDQAYFRASREARLGRSLEAVAADRDGNRVRLDEALVPLAATLATQPFLGGEAPSLADCIAFGPFQWAATASSEEVVPAESPIAAWRERCAAIAETAVAS